MIDALTGATHRTIRSEEITGRLHMSVDRSHPNFPTGKVTAKLVGGDTIAVSGALLKDMDERYTTRHLNKLKILQYQFEIIAFDPAMDVYLAKLVPDATPPPVLDNLEPTGEKPA